MLRLSSNSMNVSNLSTERIPAIHVSGHDMTMGAGVREWTGHRANMCTSTTPIVLSKDELGLHIWCNGQPKFEAWSHWTPIVLDRFFVETLSDCSALTKLFSDLRSMAESSNRMT